MELILRFRTVVIANRAERRTENELICGTKKIRMKKSLFILSFIFVSNLQIFGQCNSWLGASSGDDHGLQGAWSICTDNNNNVYSTGSFQSDQSISFGDTTVSKRRVK